MSFAAAVVLAVGVLVGMFALLFGLALVEARMFDQVMVEPEVQGPDELDTSHEPLRHAA